WERLIRREDRKLTPTCVLCEKHFEGSHVEKTFKGTVDGVDRNSQARDRASNPTHCQRYSTTTRDTPFLKRQRKGKAKKSLAGVQQQVAQMKAQSEVLSESAVEARIKRLPQKQQLAVRTGFRAAQRRSLKGMTYDDNWIVECAMMRM
ncbi:hypothetical protein HPB47_015366, partial [Ixodes persulcatus]